MSDDVLVECEDHVTILTLNRPARHNSMTRQTTLDIRAAVEDFTRDPDQRVLIVTGAGKKAFCSGADLGTMERGQKEEEASGPTQRLLPISTGPDVGGIAACPKPVIAAINGLAVGGGMEIALCCDIRIASDNAWFMLPEVKHGFLAGVAALVLPRLMPIGAVMDLMLTGDRLPAVEAYRLGLVQAVVPQEKLLEEAMRRAKLMTKLSQPALWATKASVRYWRDLTLTEHYRYYEALTHRALLSGDMLEGLRAFAEKRDPIYGGGWPDPYSASEN